MKTGYSYLVVSNGNISKLTCMESTDTCYKIKWENGTSVWLRKSDFECEFPSVPIFNIIEELK